MIIDSSRRKLAEVWTAVRRFLTQIVGRSRIWAILRGVIRGYHARLSESLGWVIGGIRAGSAYLEKELRDFFSWPIRKLCLALLPVIAVVAVVSLAVVWYLLYVPSSQVGARPPLDQVVYLDQGWGPAASSSSRQLYYYTPQGTSMLGIGLRYSWLVNLEQLRSPQRFIDPDHMRAMGFVVDAYPTDKNPDQLPVGFTRHYDAEARDDVLDITCAACHTGELRVDVHGKQVGIRIDGGQAMHAITSTRLGQFAPTLIAAMGATLLNPLRFNRFAGRVLGARYPGGSVPLWFDMAGVWLQFLKTGFRDRWYNLYPVEEGFGRTDAIARISNQVFGTELDPKNYYVGNAPVSYPALWDAPRFDWVQYSASVSQPMARNLGESLGVGARVSLVNQEGQPVPASQQFVSTAMIPNLHVIEHTLRALQPPKWPEELLGKIDPQKRDRGKALYQQHCAMCHQPCLVTPQDMAVERPGDQADGYTLWQINQIPADMVGTDPLAALNFVNVRLDLSMAGIDRAQLIAGIKTILDEQRNRTVKAYHLNATQAAGLECAEKQELDAVNLKSASIGEALHYLDIMLAKRAYIALGLTPEQQQDFNGGGALDVPQVIFQYRARPLGGVWATPPYLHNGSVPSLYEMLIPASERTKKFFVSSQTDYDPQRVGLAVSPAATKGFWLDTGIPGNQNIGHEFRAGYSGRPEHGVIGPELTDQERWDIIEYLKVHEDHPVQCAAQPLPPPPVGCPH